eukprot:scaffold2353_cov167-Amphora_coffeaeformis.AAC.42
MVSGGLIQVGVMVDIDLRLILSNAQSNPNLASGPTPRFPKFSQSGYERQREEPGDHRTH